MYIQGINEDEVDELQQVTQSTIQEELEVPMMSSAIIDDDIKMLKLPIKPKAKRVVSFIVGEASPIGQKFTKALIQVKNTSTHKLTSILLK